MYPRLQDKRRHLQCAASGEIGPPRVRSQVASTTCSKFVRLGPDRGKGLAPTLDGSVLQVQQVVGSAIELSNAAWACCCPVLQPKSQGAPSLGCHSATIGARYLQPRVRSLPPNGFSIHRLSLPFRPSCSPFNHLSFDNRPWFSLLDMGLSSFK